MTKLSSLLTRIPRPPKGSGAAILAATGVILGMLGWSLQASAAGDLQEATEVQSRKTPEEDGGSPPSLEQYRAVVTTIERSIAIRTEIDSVLGEIEEQIAALVDSQAGSRTVVEGALDSLSAIGRRLDSSVSSARSGTEELASLQDRLRRTYALARLIADELEELDESMGPSAGGGP